MNRPFIVIVGICAAGKSTLAAGLQGLGYSARSIAQEHSGVRYFWSLQKPDLLVVLDATLETVKGRRPGIGYGQDRIDEQHRRLAHAREHCHLYLATDELTIEQVRERVAALAQQWRERHGGEPPAAGSM